MGKKAIKIIPIVLISLILLSFSNLALALDESNITASTQGCISDGNSIPVIATPLHCCEGLKQILPKEQNIVGSAGICTSQCGNGICNAEIESEYNCPVDCKVKKFCKESDGGKNFDLRGETSECGVETCNSFVDECANDYVLKEGLCDNNRMIIKEFKCPFGCKEGACIKGNNTICAANKCDDGTIPRCKISEGLCICETCPPIMVKPVCGNGICEGGEGEICSTTSINKILCEEGSECKVPPIVCKIICPEDCKGIEEKIVLANLGEKFKLQVSQIAKIQDYPMKIVLKDIIAYKCKETHINEVQQEVIKEKITAANEVIAQTVPASTTSTSATVSEPNPSVSSSTSGGASSSTNPITGNPIKNNAVVAKPQPVSETKPEILKCVGAGPKALLKIHIPNDKFVSEKILNLDLNEKKRIGEVTIAFIDYDYASRTGVFVVLKDDFSCPENCKCDKEGKTIECREEKCPKGQSLCPDGTCSEKCEIIVKPEECNYGCSVDGRCFPIGIRTNGTYCGIDLVMSSQKSSDEVCDNNFECNSNICVNGKCISASFLNQIMSWFRKLFGAE